MKDLARAPWGRTLTWMTWRAWSLGFLVLAGMAAAI